MDRMMSGELSEHLEELAALGRKHNRGLDSI